MGSEISPATAADGGTNCRSRGADDGAGGAACRIHLPIQSYLHPPALSVKLLSPLSADSLFSGRNFIFRFAPLNPFIQFAPSARKLDKAESAPPLVLTLPPYELMRSSEPFFWAVYGGKPPSPERASLVGYAALTLFSRFYSVILICRAFSAFFLDTFFCNRKKQFL